MRIYLVYRLIKNYTLQENKTCMGVFSTRQDAVESIAQHHEIPLIELDAINEDDARQRVLNEFGDDGYSIDGYSVNYEIESRLLDDWCEY